MKYKVKSANVLNEADVFERKLNWQLFTAEQEAMLYSNPEDWQPGNPIYDYPKIIHEFTGNGLEFVYRGNHVRPMFQLLNDNARLPDVLCEDCEVGWDLKDLYAPCWMCGAQKNKPMHFSIAENNAFFAESISRYHASVEALIYGLVRSEHSRTVAERSIRSNIVYGEECDIDFNTHRFRAEYRGVYSNWALVVTQRIMGGFELVDGPRTPGEIKEQLIDELVQSVLNRRGTQEGDGT